MSAVADLATRVRISDPKPSMCSACLTGAQEGFTFVDFDCAHDGGSFVDKNTMANRVTIDDLHLCEACVRQAAEVLAFKPDLHRRQLREIRRLEIEAEHWKAYARRLEATLKDRPELAPSARKVRS